jgi:serine/threonine protein phosphatase 1
LTALDKLLEEINPQKEDVVVTLGDYVDRGPDSKGVMERLLELESRTTLIPLLGNHDQMLLDVIDGDQRLLRGWLSVGGMETVESYGGNLDLPPGHLEFLRNRCRLVYEPDGEDVFFVHGAVIEELPLGVQVPSVVLWKRITDSVPHISGKTMICGHTAQRSGKPLLKPGAICIDTWAFGDGWLTCLDTRAGEFIQANQDGETRRLGLDDLDSV